MTESEVKRLTYRSRDGWICYNDHKSPNVMSACDIQSTHSLKEACEIINILLERLADHEDIGTVSELRELKEKATAKKQGNVHDLDSHLRLSKSGFVCCGATNKEIRYPLISFNDLEYCPRCGQKLDWSEGKE